MRKRITAAVTAASLIATASVVSPSALAEIPAPEAPATSSIDSDKDAGEASSASEGEKKSSLDQDPENDPLYIPPEKNPVQKISSSELFLKWTDDMPEGDGKDFVQGWAKGSSIPSTANPLEWTKAEVQGSSNMVRGLFTGNFAQSSQGSSQATAPVVLAMLSVFLVGQTVELIMRGLRSLPTPR